MKKYLLGLLLIPFSLIGFSNSQLTFIENITQEYTKSPYGVLGLTDGITYNVVNLNGGPLYYQPCINSSCDTRYNISVSSSYVINSSDFSPQLQCYGNTACEFSVSYSNKSEIVPVSALTPAIDGLHKTVFELIPYVVFIGIGMLLATIGFYAIRRLVNWLSGKINSNFKSKR